MLITESTSLMNVTSFWDPLDGVRATLKVYNTYDDWGVLMNCWYCVQNLRVRGFYVTIKTRTI